jgi:membrane-associated phospholipid phosphatase
LEKFVSNLKQLISENLAFFVPGFLFWSLGIIWLFIAGKSEIHLWVNNQHFAIADFSFKYITYLGDGLFLMLVGAALFLFKRREMALTLILSYLFSTLIVQALKNSIPNNARPYIYFFNEKLSRVEGVSLLADGSFPSGHSAIGFCLFFFFATLSKQQGIKLGLGLIAVLICISRIYLNQHFLIDTLVGSIIGLLSTLAVMSVRAGKEKN